MKNRNRLVLLIALMVAAVLSGCDSPMGPDEPKQPKSTGHSPPLPGNLLINVESDESEFDSVLCFVPSYSLELIKMLHEGDCYTVNIQLDSGSYNIISEGYREGHATYSGFGTGQVSSNQTTTIDISLSQKAYEVVGSTDLFGRAEKVVVVGNYAYVQVNSAYPTYDPGLQIIDISNPDNPTSVGFYRSTYSFRDIAVAGGYAYAVCGGLRVIDVSNPSGPIEVGCLVSTIIAFAARNIEINGNYAYVSGYINFYGCGMYLWVIDISNPTNPVQVGFNYTMGTLCSVIEVSDQFAYLACGQNGLMVMDVSDPTNPNEVAQCGFSYAAWKISVSDDYIYVAGDSPNITIADISTPSDPVEVGCCYYIWYPNEIAVSQDFGYAVTDYSLIEVKATDPSNPIITGLCRLPQDTKSIAISGDYAYVACDSNGLQTVYIGEKRRKNENVEEE